MISKPEPNETIDKIPSKGKERSKRSLFVYSIIFDLL